VFAAIRKAEKSIVHISPDELKLIIAYIAANLIYENGQSPSIVQYMEIKKYTERLSRDGNDMQNIKPIYTMGQ